ncbi:hypothetical protein V1460_12755 [Streptomyces sp. SCSIO 30461]|uniref:hypothetical protein n=1 Tax=Streptomyces sp. SCSIO 30461 TaxID=3118085 RepID=UPI0030D3FCA3
MAHVTRQDDLFAPYRSGDFATARRRVRQAAFEYCAAPAYEAYEPLRHTLIDLSNASLVLSGSAEGSAAAEAFVDGVVLRKLLVGAKESGAPPRNSIGHLETFRHGIWGLDVLASCAMRLDPGHDHGWLVASIRKMLAAYHRWDEWGNGTDLSGSVAALEIFASRLAEVGDTAAARTAAKVVVQLRCRLVHS